MSRFIPKWNSDAPHFAFAAEWTLVVVAALADLLLVSPTNMRFHVDGVNGCLLLLPLIAFTVILRKLGSRRVADTLECLALMGAGSLVMCVATYIAWAYAGPLWDRSFAAFGRAVGFHWLEWYHTVAAHPRIASVLEILYVNVGFQTLYFCILMGLMGNVARMRETFRLFFVGLVVTAFVSSLMPAMGALPWNGLKGAYPFVEKARLHAGGPLDFSLDRLTGVVTFPSFHVVMILGFSYAFRGTGPVGWLIFAANMICLAGVPVFGGHYLIDMLGGAAVFALALAVVRFVPFRALREQAEGLWERILPARQAA
jgi:hypothetical protein